MCVCVYVFISWLFFLKTILVFLDRNTPWLYFEQINHKSLNKASKIVTTMVNVHHFFNTFNRVFFFVKKPVARRLLSVNPYCGGETIFTCMIVFLFLLVFAVFHYSVASLYYFCFSETFKFGQNTHCFQ